MSGFLGSDGSALVGGINPVGVAQAAGVDAQGRWLTTDQVRAYVANGQGFRATTGQIATGAANSWIGLQLVANNPALNIIIYNILVWCNASSSDVRLYQNPGSTLTDGGLTLNLLPQISNQNLGSSTTSLLSALNGSPAGTSQANPANAGTYVLGAGVVGNSSLYLLQNGSQVWLPKGKQSTLGIYIIEGTLGNKAGISLEWVEA